MSKTTKIILAIFGAALFFFVVGALGIYGKINSIRTTGIQYETALTAQYLDNQNLLSEYVSGFYEQLGIANAKSEKMDTIIKDAVSGRYGDEGFKPNGAVFSAIKEAYPDLAGLDIFDKIMDYIKAKRAEYKAIQTKLLDMLRSYDAWRADGIIQSQIVTALGIPTERLMAKIGETAYYKMEARDKMYQIVLTQDAINAYKTGVMAPLVPNK